MHVTAQKGAKHPKRFRGKPWPSVATAYEALVEEDRVKLAEANRAFMSMFEFVPVEEFEADLAEHLADLEAGAEVTGPQRRALEAAADDGLAEDTAAASSTRGVPAGVANPFRTE